VRLVTALRNGALDIAIARASCRCLGIRACRCGASAFCWPCLKTPLACKDVVYWTDLRGETVLLSQYDPGRELEDLLMSKLVSPRTDLKLLAMM